MTSIPANLQESITQAQRWRASQGNDWEWAHKRNDFWKTEGLNPKYISPKQMSGLFSLFKLDIKAWQTILDAGLNFQVLHPNGRAFSPELTDHPFVRLFILLFLSGLESNKNNPAFELLLYLKDKGLNLDAKFKGQPYFRRLVDYRWNSRDLAQVQHGLQSLERLGLNLEVRNQKGNTMLHEAILKGNWVFCEALLDGHPERFEWLGEKNRSALMFFERKIAQDFTGREVALRTLVPTLLLTLAERQKLNQAIPTQELDRTSSFKPGKRL